MTHTQCNLCGGKGFVPSIFGTDKVTCPCCEGKGLVAVGKEQPPSTTDIVQATIEERGKVYGDPYESHKNIGLAWTALLRQAQFLPDNSSYVIPASLVAQMMVVFKMQRSARVFKEDNYVDAHAYTKFAEEFQQRESKENSK